MTEYHKIQTVFLRDPATRCKTLLNGQFAKPEFEYLQGCEWVFTEKVDGTNIRVMWDGERVRFGGKLDTSQLPSRLVAVLMDMFPSERFAIFDGPACLYGEGYGAKIQKIGAAYRPDQSFVLFDVRVGDWWLRQGDVDDVAAKLSIDRVPIIGRGTLDEMVERVRAGFPSQWGGFPAEGIVARPAVDLSMRDGSRVITKLKARDFRGEFTPKAKEGEDA